jgi:hypothetical protein
VVHVRGINNTRPDTLSRLQIAAISSINQIGLSTQQIMKDKQFPATTEEKRAMIQAAHVKGHFGQQSMFMQIWHNGFWWPHIRDDIRTETKHCILCQRVNVQHQGYHPLKSINTARPMDHVQVDHIVGIPISTDGYTVIAVSKDMHTGYIWLHPLTCRK